MKFNGADFLFFFLIGDTLNLVFGFRQQCEEKFNNLECVYDVTCWNDVDLSVSSFNENNYDSTGRFSCDTIQNSNNGQYYYKIFLVYKNSTNDRDIIPIEESNMYEFTILTLVKRLDVSGNKYNTMPIFASMENLMSLNLSRNFLRIAKLSNPSELPVLSEIDLSHNTINTIEVITFENPYRSLTKINISNNYIVELPDAIFDSFIQLQTLDLSHNYIDSLSISSFEGIKKLVILMFSHNRISEINNALFRFSEIQVLDLSFNRIENIRLSDFEKLNKLEYINLQSNLIHSIDNSVFCAMEYLQSLNLRDNKLDYVEKDIFANTTNLKSFDISGNNFRTLPRGLFKGKNITQFSLEGNQLEGPLLRGSFEGLSLVDKVDLSFQMLTAIEDYAFLGLDSITKLLLNNNEIQSLSKNCFKTLRSLYILDLSNNNITDINFDPGDLINLHSISFKNNFMTHIKNEQFEGLHMLTFLDLSNNNISNIEPQSFKSLRDLNNFEISNNPLSTKLEENTFDGLSSLPILVISSTQLTIIKNSTFLGMNHLKELNASHSIISEVQYNTFIGTGSLESIDLSYNQLRAFDVNATELINLRVLFLNSNLLKIISDKSFQGLSHLNTIDLCHNHIKDVDNNVFSDQKDLRQLDLSYNLDMNFNEAFISSNTALYKLSLSGIRNVHFPLIDQNMITFLEISYAGITNIRQLGLGRLVKLENLILSYNGIVNLEIGAFSNITNLKNLDLSFNNISFIQPGVFKDNTQLYCLNVSHNALTAISYGIFRGLIHLNTLDMSYNNINSLETERFFEVHSLSVLIADHNKIDAIDLKEFAGTSLTKLSIGENPLPCEILVNFKKNGVSFTLTAIKIDESTDENVDGITCNMNGLSHSTKSNTTTLKDSDNILIDIRDVLFKIANKNNTNERFAQFNNDFHLDPNITKKIELVADKYNETLVQALNTSLQVSQDSRNTNIFLEKMLRVLDRLNTVRTQVPISISNETKSQDIIIYINKLKQEIEDDMAIQKKEILDKVKRIIEITTSPTTIEAATLNPIYEKLSESNNAKESKSNSLFTETCVGLILFILVCLVLYKFYKSRIFVRTRRSFSTRELPGSMESPSL